jgi:hypothetical protein
MFTWETIKSELRELKAVWKSVAFLVVIVAAGTWFAANMFYSERFEVMEARLKQAQEAPKNNSGAASGNDASGGAALTSWGGGIPSTCDATLNRGALAEYADKYDVALACAINYTNVDRFTDKAISIGNKFTLTDPSSVRISIPASAAMTSALESWAGAEAAKRPKEKLGTPLRVNLTIWYEVLLLPKEVLITDIRSLSDLRRLGGQVAAGQGRSVTAQNIDMAPKK